jgi:hypothetical protein
MGIVSYQLCKKDGWEGGGVWCLGVKKSGCTLLEGEFHRVEVDRG